MTRKILVVDDEKCIRESLSKVLQAEGYDVVLAENGQEAIAKLAKEPVDLMLLDIGLPIKDGWATMRALGHVAPLLPVILITGLWKQGDLAEAAEVDVLMEKPLDLKKLFQVIQELLQETQEARSKRIHDCGRSFHIVPCDGDEFRAHLREAYLTPFPCDEKSIFIKH